MKTFISLILLVLTLACSGSNSSQSNNNSKSTQNVSKYGIFRPLKSENIPTPMISQSASSPVSSTMCVNRAYFKSIQMLNGNILIVGGDLNGFGMIPNEIPNSSGVAPVPGTMDIYNPITETFTKSNALLTQVRAAGYTSNTGYENFSLVNLPDGRVVILGNRTSGNYGYYEIYNPSTDTVDVNTIASIDGSLWPSLSAVDYAYYIGNNQIIIFESSSLEAILDLPTNTLTSLVNPTYIGVGAVEGASTIQVPNGDIYMIGGDPLETDSNYTPVYSSVNFIAKFDNVTREWSKVANLNTGRSYTSLVLLSGDRIGIYGGRNYNATNSNVTLLSSVEIFNYDTNAVTQSIDLVGSRVDAVVAPLQTGYTLIAGGISSGNTPLVSQLVHNPDLSFSGSTNDMTMPRADANAIALSNGLVLVTGGYTGIDNSNWTNTAEIFDPQAALYMGYQSESMTLNSTMQFRAKDAKGNSINATWTVDNSAIAVIDANGVLTSVAPGIVQVTATSGNNTAVARINILNQ